MDSITKALARSFGSNPSAGPAPGGAAQVDSEVLADQSEGGADDEAAQIEVDSEQDDDVESSNLAQIKSKAAPMMQNLSHLTGVGKGQEDSLAAQTVNEFASRLTKSIESHYNI